MQPETSVFENGELKIDYTAGCTYLKGEELHLTPIEYKLLCLLSRNVGRVLTHTYITRQIWGRCSENDVASLRVFMATLRKNWNLRKMGGNISRRILVLDIVCLELRRSQIAEVNAASRENCHVCHRQIWRFVLSGRIIEYTKSRGSISKISGASPEGNRTYIKKTVEKGGMKCEKMAGK